MHELISAVDKSAAAVLAGGARLAVALDSPPDGAQAATRQDQRRNVNHDAARGSDR